MLLLSLYLFNLYVEEETFLDIYSLDADLYSKIMFLYYVFGSINKDDE
jgi:hypothetical protein